MPKPNRVNGGWGEWSPWSCTVTCGSGTKTRDRACNAPRPQNGGLYCRGDWKENGICVRDPCPVVNGGWNEWSPWSCTVTCGRGTKTRDRACNAPRPQNGGLYCRGDWKENGICVRDPCPVNGGWGEWSPWSCTVTCGRGTKTRDRACNAPRPQNGGLYCRGDWKENGICVRDPCPVNGGWGEWSPWSCTVTCGRGTKTRDRACNAPRPQNGGLYCRGDWKENGICVRDPCPGSDRPPTESNTDKEVCALPKDHGDGPLTHHRWYYDNGTMTCKPLKYRGSGGNGNRFVSRENCSTTCNGRCYQPVPDSHNGTSLDPDCDGGGLEWYYHTDRGLCLPFRTRSCQMMDTGNRFPTKDECKRDCIPNGLNGPTDDELVPESEEECYESENGVDYRGLVYTTITEKTCQKWTSQTPHSHSRTPDNYRWKGLGDHNFCRNPDGKPSSWCYTTDPGKRWELCNVGPATKNCGTRPTTESANKEGGPFAFPMPTPDRGTDRPTTESDTNKEVCALPRDYGYGQYIYSRWYYDNSAKVCKVFRYRGSGGNRNRFFSYQECSTTCDSRCYQPVPISHYSISHFPDCDGGGFEWYYHSDRDVCLPFRTSFCHMTDTSNIFPTKNECKQYCIPNGRFDRF
ncbi:uncharacterized protein [Antedon mediterranea]|uniref:uncharacterized protein n=1 Tax=Antedon mediterranea TaxID=105859 RepID=UPI003AF5E0E0